MQNKILKLAKRLNKFTLDEISSIAEMEEQEIKLLLETLEEIEKSGEVYLYIGKSPILNNKLISRQKFEYHPKETINLIIKCFCANIDADKTVNITEPERASVFGFYRIFREFIYEKQKEILTEHIKKNPKIACERTFFNKTIYFYCYKKTVFISNENIDAKNLQKHTKEEIKQIKKIYSRLRRKLNRTSYKKNIENHIAEQIWQINKPYEELLESFSTNKIFY